MQVFTVVTCRFVYVDCFKGFNKAILPQGRMALFIGVNLNYY